MSYVAADMYFNERSHFLDGGDKALFSWLDQPFVCPRVDLAGDGIANPDGIRAGIYLSTRKCNTDLNAKIH